MARRYCQPLDWCSKHNILEKLALLHEEGRETQTPTQSSENSPTYFGDERILILLRVVSGVAWALGVPGLCGPGVNTPQKESNDS